MPLIDNLSSLLCWGIADIIDALEDCSCDCESIYGMSEEEDDISRFVGSQLGADGRSTMVFNFEATTPGDILGVSIYDSTLSREDLKRAANQVFKNTHNDRFHPRSPFARAYKIDSIEKANAVFSVYRKAYEEFCKKKGWST